MATQLQDRVAIVTGAASGIGRATAVAFARAGISVVVSDIDESGGEETVRLIATEDGNAAFVRADVADPADAEALVASTIDSFGRVDYAFNNAGIEGQMATTEDCTEENWDRVLGVNLKGVWLCMRSEIPVMKRQGGGVIVNCASVAGLVGFRNLPAYCASKGGVVELTRAAALECAESNIRVNSVCPGVIKTPMVERLIGNDAQVEAQFTALEPVGRLGRPEEVADCVIWLCSEGASFVTGHALTVDGGLVAQ